MRSDITTFCLICVLLFVSVSSAQFTQWEPENGVPIRQGNHINWYSNCMATNDQGQTCIVWISAEQGPFLVYAMLMDVDGEPLWDAPVAANITDNHCRYPDVIPDGNRNWYIGWGEMTAYVYDPFVGSSQEFVHSLR